MARLAAIFFLTRPVNCLITALSVGVGALTGNGLPLTLPVLGAAISAVLVTAAGNAFNDALDLEIDRINRPERPLAAGRLSQGTALGAAALMALAGGLLAGTVSPVHLLLASAVIAGLAGYTLWLKGTVLWGNLVVAALAAAAFPYGALAVGDWGRSWIPAGLAFLFHLGREIVKDLEDLKGDQALGLRTLPLRWGVGRAALIASAIYLLLIGFTFLPWIAGIYPWPYLLGVCLVDLLVLYVLTCLGRLKACLADDRLGRLLKVGMLLGLSAIGVGELSR